MWMMPLHLHVNQKSDYIYIYMDPVLFLQFIKCYGLDINAWDRGFLAKKCKKCNEKSHIETSYIYFDNAFINTAS